MKKKVITHILFWLVYFSFNSTIAYVQSKNSFIFRDQFIKYGTGIIFFYCIIICYYYLLNTSILKKLISFIFNVLLFYFIRFLAYYHDTSFMNFQSWNIDSIIKFLISGSWWWVHYLIYSLFYIAYQRNLSIEEEKNKLQKENHQTLQQNLQLQIENEKLTNQKMEADYNYLRTQINPHFLYNTLSFFYTKIAAKDAVTAEGIHKLTNLMRYSLHQGDELGRVPLLLEVENVEHYIGIQQMRFGNSLQLVYHKNIPDHTNLKILPHLIITVVENAFKHGNNTKIETPLQVHITLLNNELQLTVCNLINKAQSEMPSTKTGLANMQNRLQLVYKNKQTFTYSSKNDDLFTVTLKLDLSDAHNIIQPNEVLTAEAYLQQPAEPSTVYFNKAALL